MSFIVACCSATAGQFGLFGDDGRQVGVAIVDQATLTISTERGQFPFARRPDLDTQKSVGFQRLDGEVLARWPVEAPGPVFFGRLANEALVWDDMKIVRGAVVPPVAPRPAMRTLISEQIVPNPPLEPAEVRIVNSHSKDLIVGFVDLTKKPLKPRDQLLPAGSSQTYLLKSDAGSTIERVYELVTPAGSVVRQVERTPIQPARIWDLVVSEYKVTYQVVGMPELTQRSRRSLGVVSLPAGAELPEEIDVYEEVLDSGNPGAAALYGSPIGR